MERASGPVMLAKGGFWRNSAIKGGIIMRILLVIAGFLALFPPVARAQEARATIQVTGQGQIRATPDMATITLGVTRQATGAAQALEQVAQVSAGIFERLQKAAIAPRDMQTSNLNLRPLYSDPSSNGAAPRITGYEASNMVTIRVHDLDGLGGILDMVIQEGANQFNGLQFGVQKQDALMDRARVAAVEDAMARARLLTGAAGVTLGPVLSIPDASGGGPLPVMAEMALARAGAMPVAAGELTLLASVTMVFALVP